MANALRRGTPGSASTARTRIPLWSSDRASSAGEHSIPSDHSPRTWRRPICVPPGSVVPARASGTKSPAPKLKAPHTTCSCSPPASTSTSWTLSAPGWERVASTRATTMLSSTASLSVTPSTTRPSSLRASTSAGVSASMGAKSFSQERGTLMGSELFQEPDVVDEEVALVVDLMADLGQAVDAESEGEAAPFLGVDAAVAQHVGMHHPAAAQLYPACLGADPAARAMTEDACDFELGRRLGEREVRRPQPRVRSGAEVGGGERLDGARKVSERDALVDDQALDLVEDRQVAGIRRLVPIHPAGHHRVDRRPLGFHHPDLHGRRVRAQHDALGLAQLEVEGVPHAAGRVGGRHVEGFEVVPVVLGFGPFGDLVAHPDEHVLELVTRLGGEMEVTPAGTGNDLGEVESLGFQPTPALGLGEGDTALLDGRLQPGSSVVDAPACLLALVGGEGAKTLIEGGDRRSLPQELVFDSAQLVERGDSAHALDPRRRDLLEFVRDHAPTSSSKDLEGSVKRNVEPSPGAEAAESLPPWASTRPRLIQRPKPEPVGRVSARRKNLVKMRGRSELGIPSPLSLTDTATMSASSGDVQRSPLMQMPLGSAYLAAFSTRLVRTCSTLSGSA